MENGWIKLHSSILKHPVFTCGDSILFQLFTYCLLRANWKNTDVVLGNQVIHLKRGQFITGRSAIVHDLVKPKNKRGGFTLSETRKWESVYRRKLEMLVSMQIVTIEKTNKYTVVTVQNWSKYQGSDQQMTNKRPTDDQQMTTDKKYKNIRNIDTNVSIGDDSPMGVRVYGNNDVNKILLDFKRHKGQIPSDASPRRVAHNINQIVTSFLKQHRELFLSLRGEELTAEYVYDKFYLNLKQKEYIDKIEKLETVKQKLRVYLDTIGDKLTAEGRNYDNKDTDTT